MNSNRSFVFLLSLVQAVVLLSVLFVDHLLVSSFGLHKENFFLISTFLILLGIGLFWFFSYGVFETFFKTQTRLKTVVRKTLHELNTPVATIKINTKMLKKNEKDAKKIAKLDRIDKACSNLLSMYEQMEYSIKKEVHSIEKSRFDLRELVQESIKKFEDIKESITVYNEVAADITVYSDKKGFATVVDNLLSNAIKYNQQGGFVKFCFNDKTLIIQDSGKGIDTKNLFVVFDNYYQEDPVQSGFGMGLAMVKEFCDTHKISINIDSKEGKGTTFYLDLKDLEIDVPFK